MDRTLEDDALGALLRPIAERASAPDASPLDVRQAVGALVAWLRPAGPAPGAGDAVARLRTLAEALRRQPQAAARLASAVTEWVRESRSVPLFAEAGILSTRGFLGEIGARLYERVLPAPPRPGDFLDAFGHVFDRPRDGDWVASTPPEAWVDLARAFGLFEGGGTSPARALRESMVRAAEVLAMRVAGSALETELLRVDPRAERHDSPFLALQHEVAELARVPADPAHADVLLDQCFEAIDRLRGRGRQRGTSVRVTYLLERMEQQLRRLQLLLHAVWSPDPAVRGASAWDLFVDLVRASGTRNQVAPVWRANMRLIAKRVTENASRTGEHYVSRDRAEYFGMMRAAMGAGVLIAFMALLKIGLKALHLPPLVETALVCADYALGFVVIHLLHFTVATKQPAMTAATIAATVEEARGGRAPLDGLVSLIAGVTRTQAIAIVGNVALALPLSLAIGEAWLRQHGAPLVGEEKAMSLLHELRPIAGWAVAHAAIAGVWLFVAGLVTGWYDNRCAVLDVPARLRGSPLLAWLPTGTRERIAAYVDGNLGALMGNAIFGILLGATGLVGYLVGLPIDIRHVAFASANLGYAMGTIALGLESFLLFLLFVFVVGFVNLVVSFSLALNVAMRARGVTFGRAGELVRALWAAFRRDPRAFLLPPPKEK